MPNTVSSGRGLPRILDVRAEFAAVERPRHHRAAALRAARGFGVIVRKGQRHVEAHARSLLVKKSTAFGPGGQKRIDARGIEAVAGLVPQIGARLIRALRRCPRRCASEVPGIQSQPPERAVVPPKRGSFSTIRTLRP